MELEGALANQQQQLCSIFANLSEDQFARPSLCHAFDIHLVLAHLVAQLSTPPLKRALSIARQKRNRPLAQLTRARDVGREGSKELLERYRQLIENPKSPSAKVVIERLTDTVIHTVDVCRPLGLALPEMDVDFAPILSFLASDTALLDFVAAPLPNVTFVASDTAWQAGRGPQVHGAALDLAMAMTARPNATRGLHGPGVESVAQWARVHGR